MFGKNYFTLANGMANIRNETIFKQEAKLKPTIIDYHIIVN